MIITCPNCQTKYQVTYDAIGSAGRKVQCAHCQQAWQQAPAASISVTPDVPAESDRLFDNLSEDALDEVLQSEERAVASEQASKEDGDAARRQAAAASKAKLAEGDEAAKRQQAFTRRQSAMISSLPMARLRRTARWAAALVLVGLFAGAYFGRVQLVERYPAMAGVYEAIGLGVNVVGLDLSDLETLRMLSEGKEVLVVSAQIVGLMPEPVSVPPIVVSLLDLDGNAVYEWSVAPRVRDLMAGERATFEARLALPPDEARRVKLSFAAQGASAATLKAPQHVAPGEGVTGTDPHPASAQDAGTHDPVAPAAEAHAAAPVETAPADGAHH